MRAKTDFRAGEVWHDPDRSSRLRLLAEALIGGAKLPMQVRLLNAVSFTSLVATIVMVAANVVQGNPLLQWVLSSVAVLCTAAIYFGSRFMGRSELRVHFCVVASALAAIGWFTNDGTSGGAVWLCFVLLAATAGLLRGLQRRIFPLAIGAGLLGLLALEWIRPDLLVPHESIRHRDDDLAVMFLLCLVVTTFIAYFLAESYRRERQRSLRLYERLQLDNERVQQAIREIGVLEGLLPICAHCKSIRDSGGSWQSPESYLGGHAADLAHQVCPRCDR